MTWDYRVMRTTDPDGTHVFAVYEVYYDENGSIEMWTESPTWPQGESFRELYDDFVHYGHAFGSKPVLFLENNETEIWDAGPMGTKKRELVWRKI